MQELISINPALLTLENIMAEWEIIAGNPSRISIADDRLVIGNFTLPHSDDDILLVYRTLIPYDKNDTYRWSIKYKKLNSYLGLNKFGAGFIGFASDGVTVVDISGGSDIFNAHFHASQLTNYFDDTFYGLMPLTGYTKGVNTVGDQNPGGLDFPAKAHQDVAYIKPFIMANFRDPLVTPKLYVRGSYGVESFILENYRDIFAATVGGSPSVIITPSANPVTAINNQKVTLTLTTTGISDGHLFCEIVRTGEAWFLNPKDTTSRYQLDTTFITEVFIEDGQALLDLYFETLEDTWQVSGNFYVRVRSESETGTILATSATITVNVEPVTITVNGVPDYFNRTDGTLAVSILASKPINGFFHYDLTPTGTFDWTDFGITNPSGVPWSVLMIDGGASIVWTLSPTGTSTAGSVLFELFDPTDTVVYSKTMTRVTSPGYWRYEIGFDKSSIGELYEIATLSVTCDDIPDGETITAGFTTSGSAVVKSYVTTPLETTDLQLSVSSGSYNDSTSSGLLNITKGLTSTISIYSDPDYKTEGMESLIITLNDPTSGSLHMPTPLPSAGISIVDTTVGALPQYMLSATSQVINEGQSITISLSVYNNILDDEYPFAYKLLGRDNFPISQAYMNGTPIVINSGTNYFSPASTETPSVYSATLVIFVGSNFAADGDEIWTLELLTPENAIGFPSPAPSVSWRVVDIYPPILSAATYGFELRDADNRPKFLPTSRAAVHKTSGEITITAPSPKVAGAISYVDISISGISNDGTWAAVLLNPTAIPSYQTYIEIFTGYIRISFRVGYPDAPNSVSCKYTVMRF